VRATRTDKKLLTLRDGDVNRGFGFLVGMDILSLERMEGGGGGGGGGQTE